MPQQLVTGNVSFYNVQKSKSFANDIKKGVKRKKDFTTFGAKFDSYQKVMANHSPYHYYGRGPDTYLGTESKDLKLLRKNERSYSLTKTERGVLPK